MEGRLKGEQIRGYTQLIPLAVEQKLAQQCKAITLQLKRTKTKTQWPEEPHLLFHGCWVSSSGADFWVTLHA